LHLRPAARGALRRRSMQSTWPIRGNPALTPFNHAAFEFRAEPFFLRRMAAGRHRVTGERLVSQARWISRWRLRMFHSQCVTDHNQSRRPSPVKAGFLSLLLLVVPQESAKEPSMLPGPPGQDLRKPKRRGAAPLNIEIWIISRLCFRLAARIPSETAITQGRKCGSESKDAE